MKRQKTIIGPVKSFLGIVQPELRSSKSEYRKKSELRSPNDSRSEEGAMHFFWRGSEVIVGLRISGSKNPFGFVPLCGNSSGGF